MAESHRRCVPRACLVLPPRQTALTTDQSERSCRCRYFMLTACGLPLRSQALHTAVAVINMLELMPPLRGEDGVCALSTRSTRGTLALAPDT